MAKKPNTTSTNNATTTATANKSESIRNYHAANPNATPAEIAKALTEKGVEVSASRVSTVLANGRRGSRVDVAKIKLASAFVKNFKGKVDDAETAIGTVGQFIDDCGSSTAAIAALSAFKELASAIS